MTNGERELVDGIAINIQGEICCACEYPCKCYEKAANEVVKYVKANLGKIAEVCKDCQGMGKDIDFKGRWKNVCNVCSGTGIVLKGK